ncbi:MAG: hypothetical protein J3K34DRAFT_521613 [Monoraphidium minutum]|nr:MAG: hypothetical protein J3K34DRAFT_521613 [Monoraphidium minutum]
MSAVAGAPAGAPRARRAVSAKSPGGFLGQQQQQGQAAAASAQQQLLSSWEYGDAFGADADAWDLLPPTKPRHPKGPRGANLGGAGGNGGNGGRSPGAAAGGSGWAPEPEDADGGGEAKAAAGGGWGWEPEGAGAAAAARGGGGWGPEAASSGGGGEGEVIELGDAAIPPRHLWEQELAAFQPLTSDPERPWARRLVLRLCYCRNPLEARCGFRAMTRRAMVWHLNRRYSVERGVAASMHELQAAHRRLALLHEGVVGGSGTLQPVEVAKEREELALMRERMKRLQELLSKARRGAAAAGDTHYCRTAARLSSLLARAQAAATALLKARLKGLVAASGANLGAAAARAGGGGGSSDGGGADAPREAQPFSPQREAQPPPPPAPLTDLLADYRRLALEFDCFRDPSLFTRPPPPGHPSSAGGRYFDNGGAPAGAEGRPGASQSGRRQAMLGNASHLFRAQRLPLLRPAPSALAAYLQARQEIIRKGWRQRWRRVQQGAGGQEEGGGGEDGGGGAGEEEEDFDVEAALADLEAALPPVGDLAEASLSGRDLPPQAVLLRRAAALERELFSGRLRGVLAEQRAAAAAAGEPDAAVRGGGWRPAARGRRGGGAEGREEWGGDEGKGEGEGEGEGGSPSDGEFDRF